MKRILGLVFMLLVFVLGALAQKQEDKSSSVNFVVVKATNGKPVANAAVVLHTLDKDGRQGSGGINLKTNMEGKTQFDGVPFGKLRVQVIARGFQTYGDDIEINQENQNVTVKLKPPASQYSIYDDSSKPPPEKK